MATDMTVANEILRQLGGRRFIVMTGAKDFVGSENTLSFTLPKAVKKMKKIVIKLNSKDYYDVEYGYIDKKTFEWKVVQSFNDIDCEQLPENFELTTGLLTRL